MWRPDINLKCPAGQNTRRCTRNMAHRKRMFRGRVTLVILAAMGFGLLLAGSIFISNQTVGLRTDIAALESRREYLEAGSGQLLTKWNAVTSAPIIIHRARKELGLVVPEDPDLVLVCRDVEDNSDNSGLWRKFLSKFGGGNVAQAAGDQAGLVVGSMVSLTPRTDPVPRTTGGLIP